MDTKTIATHIVQYAESHQLQLHPGQDSLKWAELVIRKGGGCPCVPGRTRCPCNEALEDIAEINRCRCGLFVNDAYVEEYNTLRARRRGKYQKPVCPGKQSAE